MRYIQVLQIKEALDKLGTEKLPIAYEIAKNIKACDKIITETQEIAKTIMQKYADRDEKGELVSYTENNMQLMKITDTEKLNYYKLEMAKIDSENYTPDFVKISRTNFEGKDLAANILVPLIDVIIE